MTFSKHNWNQLSESSKAELKRRQAFEQGYRDALNEQGQQGNASDAIGYVTGGGLGDRRLSTPGGQVGAVGQKRPPYELDPQNTGRAVYIEGVGWYWESEGGTPVYRWNGSSWDLIYS